ncbi:MAG: NAD(+)/NADH kinase [Treponema sp.]|nr:NAD(+)/NADH kinase [Treponema sp.]
MSGLNVPRPEGAVLFINPKKDCARTLAEAVQAELDRRNIPWDTFCFDRKPDFTAQAGYRIAFSLGGDGTVLYAARAMAPLGVPVFPVNLGTLGFIAAIHAGEWLEVFERWLQGTAGLSRRLMLAAAVMRGGREVVRGICLNDIVISASGIAKLIRLRVSSGDMSLGEYRSDGLIAATPTGSTAYSVAAGGPILDPELEALIVNPICPFTLSHRPMVLPSGETLTVEVDAEQRSGVLLTADGQVTEPLEPGDTILIAKAPHPALLIASGRKSFYHALRTKLSWLGVPGDAGASSGGCHA